MKLNLQTFPDKIIRWFKFQIVTFFYFLVQNFRVRLTLINELVTLRFIDEAKNILLLGPSGVGKTHIAISLGYKATTERIKTKFITTSDLLLQLENADTANKLNDYLKRAIYPNKLLIIDEFGYIKFNEKNIELIHFVLSNGIEVALEISSIEEAVLAENLGAKFLIIENQKLANKVQRIAEHYLFDSKILVLINNPHEIEEIAKLRIDGAILKNHIVH